MATREVMNHTKLYQREKWRRKSHESGTWPTGNLLTPKHCSSSLTGSMATREDMNWKHGGLEVHELAAWRPGK